MSSRTINSDKWSINTLADVLRGVTPATARVRFDFCGCIPTTIDSWRGIYAEPALGWSPAGYTRIIKQEDYPTCESLVKMLEDSTGREFTGWKGGEFYFTGDETLHIDNEGDCTYTCIDRLEIVDDDVASWAEVVIHTHKECEQ